MKSNSQKNAELTHRNRGGQHAFPSVALPIIRKSPSLRGFFCPKFNANALLYSIPDAARRQLSESPEAYISQ
ncbi:hypothetical protein VRC29_02855 [Erwinia aphidicola]|uniref:hypothetical protein n=1 Tax=Erwinia aphidicola TaxID=68334 RepID=UPI0030CE9AB5